MPQQLPDFEVFVTFVDAEHGGRKNPANQGYRPDVMFEGDDHLYMIHPEFLADDGLPYPTNTTIPQSARANMYVFYPETRPIIREKVRIGESIRIVEGLNTVATAVVTAIINLPNDAPP